MKIEKGIYFSIGLASLVKREAEKNTKKLIEEGMLRSKYARRIISKVVAETKKEGNKLEKFLVTELKQEMKKVKPVVKKSIEKVKKTAKKKK